MIAVQCLLVAVTFAQQSSPPEKQPKMLSREVRLVDQAGKPVVGAKTKALAFNERMYFASMEGLNSDQRTNEDGLTKFFYPDLKAFAIESVTVATFHSDFRGAQVVVPIGAEGEKPFEVRLTPGISLSISAVDENGDPTKEPFGILVSGPDGPSLWRRPEPHTAVCSSMGSGNRQIMLVQDRKDGGRYFSEVRTQRFDLDKEPRVAVEEVELQPGVAIRGKLASTVPRPVQNGIVIAAQAPLPAGDSWDEQLPSLIYMDWTNVNEDGTFVFASMPQTGTLQLLAICDDWVGVQGK